MGFSYQLQLACDPPLTCREQVDLAGNAFNGGVCEAVLFALVVGSDWKTIVGHMLSARRMAKMKESTAMQDEGEDEDSIDGEEQLESEQEVSRSEALDFESDCYDLD